DPADITAPDVIHPLGIMRGVVRGVRDYGNRMGIPTVNGAIRSKKRTGTRLRSGPLPPAKFLAYTQPGPPSKDDGGMTADGEAEDAAWKASDDYRQKGIYVIYVLFEEKSK
ncbi:hypothetical protein, partial [Bilophila wadsworthia]|uniref:hypothetical protein n=1 Tax=Bilophila wadsworthia TaxID=35833 RepID=UPI003AB32778